METDRAFAEIFGHRPDWLALLAGKAWMPGGCAKPGSFKTTVECDLVLEQADGAAPQLVCEFQFYHDQSIFVRTDLARLLRWKEINPAEQCRLRNFVPRGVEALIVFGEKGHIPAGAEEFPHIRWVVLRERLAEIEREEPGFPLVALLRPVVVSSDAEVEVRAAADYHVLLEHAGLSDDDRRCFSTLFVQFLMQRFKAKTAEEINTMIAELVPVEETRAGRELIERGMERGIERGIERGMERGIERGIEQGADEIVLLLLERVCGGLDQVRRKRVEGLPVEKAKELALALLEFRAVEDLDAWFDAHA